jgi:hypothetical protein
LSIKIKLIFKDIEGSAAYNGSEFPEALHVESPAGSRPSSMNVSARKTRSKFKVLHGYITLRFYITFSFSDIRKPVLLKWKHCICCPKLASSAHISK